ncbi:non-ribosomal peptide synthetase [Paenibacillus sp. SYP-B4298]|uniref:non-ribosomal peptide synthetase n=1 Tax=Paenibacillus sp. SYP-B4298 TaxID=2996034 RepID=UPI0022DD3D75|nr:non-ribosomal peptide synthetase [Paenibacillus sp. SYP-B4298]
MSQDIQLQRVSRQQSIPLTIEQYRLWFLQQLEPDSVQFNINWAFYAHGALDEALFAQSLNQLIRRHESLRTVFRQHGAEPEQVILDKLEIDIQTFHLSSLPEEGREQHAIALMHQSIAEPILLDTGPLLRMSLYRIDTEYHIMLITIHHIVCDFVSLEKMIQELIHYYYAYATGKTEAERELPPLPVQFADYAVWQKQRLQGESYHKQLAYWKEKLGGELPVLRMPLDRPRPPVMTHQGQRTKFAFSEEWTSKIKQFSRKNGVTLFMALLAAYQTVLYRYTLQEDLCIGTSVSSRSRPELQPLIGMFVNTLVLRTKLDGNPTFSEVLKRMRKTAFGAFAHQDIPFEKLIEELNAEREASHNPFFQTMFTLLSAADHAEEGTSLPGLQLVPFEFKEKASALELSFTMTEQGGVLLGTMDYNSDLYDKDTIDRLLRHFQHVLQSVVEQPGQPIQQIPLMPETEKAHMLETMSGKHQVWPLPQSSVHQMVADQAARTPHAVAILHNGVALTYQELDERSQWLAQQLRASGGSANRFIGVCLERSIELIVALLAVMKSGSAYVPIDPNYPEERIAYLLEDSGVHTVIVSPDTKPLVRAASTASPLLLAEAEAAAARDGAGAPLPVVNPEQLMYVIYTSGSTGKPKGVMVPHQAVVNHCLGVMERFELRPSDRVLQFTSISFDVAVQEIFPALLAGATLVLWKDRFLTSSSEFLQWIGQEQVTVVNATTAHWNQLVHDVKQNLASLPEQLRLVIVGGEAVSRETYASWRSIAKGRVKWINDYGLTETTITATMFCPDGDWQAVKAVPIGTPLPNVEVYILDSSLQPVPVGVYGELCVGGAGVAHGYLNRPELTAERFVSHPFRDDEGARLFRTGDMARFLPDGNIEFVGRLDSQIKIRGYRIELGEIEAALEQCPALAQSVVVPNRLNSGDTMLVAYVVPANPQVDLREIREHLKHSLPDYMIPGNFVVIDRIPLTENGKVNTALLPKPELPALTAKEYIAPRTSTEQAAVELWSEVLGLASLSVLDNYFDIGGNSLLATQLAAKAQQRFGSRVPLKWLFEYPTLEDWAMQVEQLTEQQLADTVTQSALHASESCLVQINRTGSQLPICLIHPVGGSISCYFALARQLGASQPLYAMQAPGLAGTSMAGTMTVEQMAEAYVRELLAIQPAGPYRLGGWSLGGFIAYEMARQLLASGHEVYQLILIDSYLNRQTEINDEVIFYNFIRQLAVGVNQSVEEYAWLSWDRFKEHSDAAICRQLKAAGLIPGSMEDDELRRIFSVYADTARAFNDYRPAAGAKLPIQEVQLFRGEDFPQEERVWGRLVESFTVYPVQADHFSIVQHEEVGRQIHRSSDRLAGQATGESMLEGLR